MKINIKMLDVGDADAIIVHLTRNVSEHFVMLIDGGAPDHAEHVIDELDKLLRSIGKVGPDLVVCTHYDSDHIGGLLEVAKKYRTLIGEFWIHDHEMIKPVCLFAKQVLDIRKKSNLKVMLSLNEHTMKSEFSQVSDFLLESYPQMLTLIEYLNHNDISWISPLAGQSVKGWEDIIRVIGPTMEFYKLGISKIKHSPNQVINEQVLATRSKGISSLSKLLNESIRIEADPCAVLGNKNKTVTWINKISIIIQFVVNDQKYLFTGDTSVNALQSIPDYENLLSNIHWLKVAHHGSRNNSSPEIFDLMKPKFADISGGHKYFDEEVRQCLKAKKTKVRLTKDEGDLQFP